MISLRPERTIVSTTPLIKTQGYDAHYGVASGNAEAAAIVAGAIGLVKARTPTATVAQIKANLCSSATKVKAMIGKNRCGGHLNIGALVKSF